MLCNFFLYTEFDKFLEALKSEKLSKKLLSNKDKLIELLKKLRDDYPALAPTPTNDIEGKISLHRAQDIF